MAKRKNNTPAPDLFADPTVTEPVATEPVAAPAPTAEPVVNPEMDLPSGDTSSAAAPTAEPVAPTAKPKRKRKAKATAKPSANGTVAAAAAPTVPPAVETDAAKALDVSAVENQETAGQRLQRLTLVTRLGFKWFGNSKRATKAKNATAAAAVGVKKVEKYKGGFYIISPNVPEFKALNSLRSRLTAWWKGPPGGITVPWIREGERLIRRDDWDGAQSQIAEFRAELATLCAAFDAALPRIREECRADLQDNFREEWLSLVAADTFRFTWEVVPVEPPDWMKSACPEQYEEQMQLLQQRFESAAVLGTEALAQQFGKALAHLEEVLTPDPITGDKKTFRDSAVDKLGELFKTVRHLNITGNAQLEAFLQRGETLLQGVTPSALRQLGGLPGQSLADRVRAQLTPMLDSLSDTFLIDVEGRGGAAIVRDDGPPPSDDDAADDAA